MQRNLEEIHNRDHLDQFAVHAKTFKCFDQSRSFPTAYRSTAMATRVNTDAETDTPCTKPLILHTILEKGQPGKKAENAINMHVKNKTADRAPEKRTATFSPVGLGVWCLFQLLQKPQAVHHLLLT